MMVSPKADRREAENGPVFMDRCFSSGAGSLRPAAPASVSRNPARGWPATAWDYEIRSSA